MLKSKFDERLDDRLMFFVSNSRANEESEETIEKEVKEIIDKTNEYFDSHMKGLTNILGQRKIANKDNKFANYSFEDTTKAIRDFNICRASDQETEDHIYHVVTYKISAYITNLVLWLHF